MIDREKFKRLKWKHLKILEKPQTELFIFQRKLWPNCNKYKYITSVWWWSKNNAMSYF